MHPQDLNIDDLIQRYIQEGIRKELEKRNSQPSLSEAHYTRPVLLSSPSKQAPRISPTAWWLPPIEAIDELYYPLKEELKVDCGLETLKTIFIHPELITEPIIWLGLDNEFACLFGKLHTRKLIKKSGYWEFLCKKFCRIDGTRFDPRSLSTQFSQNKVNSDFEDFVNEIIAKIKSVIIKVNKLNSC